MNPLIEVIAQEVRYWAESRSDKDNLCGMCAIATAELWTRLRNENIKSEIHLWENRDGSHVFLVVDDMIVDITATQFIQFKHTPVLIMHQREGESVSYYHRSSKVFSTADELRRFQKKTRWPVNQIAHSV